MNEQFNKILSKISDRKLKHIDKREFANELGLDVEGLKEQLTLMQEEDLIEYESFTITMWKVRITSNGYRHLELAENSEIYQILKFIENSYKTFQEIKKHFGWDAEKTQIIWDRYFEHSRAVYIQPRDRSGSGSHQEYTASVKGKEYLLQNTKKELSPVKKSIWNVISSNPIAATVIGGLILLAFGLMFGLPI